MRHEVLSAAEGRVIHSDNDCTIHKERKNMVRLVRQIKTVAPFPSFMQERREILSFPW